MCGRYGADESINDWIKNHCRGVADDSFRLGDIRPGETAPVLIAGRLKPMVVPMIWGFRKTAGQGLIINARKETLWEKPVFRQSVQKRRCLLPASRFYEWDISKHKVVFRGEQGDILFLAGIYEEDAAGRRFIIITAPADDAVRPVHDRMPVRILEELVNEWLSVPEMTRDILNMPQAAVRREQEVEQMRLW